MLLTYLILAFNAVSSSSLATWIRIFFTSIVSADQPALAVNLPHASNAALAGYRVRALLNAIFSLVFSKDFVLWALGTTIPGVLLGAKLTIILGLHALSLIFAAACSVVSNTLENDNVNDSLSLPNILTLPANRRPDALKRLFDCVLIQYYRLFGGYTPGSIQYATNSLRFSDVDYKRRKSSRNGMGLLSLGLWTSATVAASLAGSLWLLVIFVPRIIELVNIHYFAREVFTYYKSKNPSLYVDGWDTEQPEPPGLIPLPVHEIRWVALPLDEGEHEPVMVLDMSTIIDMRPFHLRLDDLESICKKGKFVVNPTFFTARTSKNRSLTSLCCREMVQEASGLFNSIYRKSFTAEEMMQKIIPTIASSSAYNFSERVFEGVDGPGISPRTISFNDIALNSVAFAVQRELRNRQLLSEHTSDLVLESDILARFSQLNRRRRKWLLYTFGIFACTSLVHPFVPTLTISGAANLAWKTAILPLHSPFARVTSKIAQIGNPFNNVNPKLVVKTSVDKLKQLGVQMYLRADDYEPTSNYVNSTHWSRGKKTAMRVEETPGRLDLNSSQFDKAGYVLRSEIPNVRITAGYVYRDLPDALKAKPLPPQSSGPQPEIKWNAIKIMEANSKLHAKKSILGSRPLPFPDKTRWENVVDGWRYRINTQLQNPVQDAMTTLKNVTMGQLTTLKEIALRNTYKFPDYQERSSRTPSKIERAQQVFEKNLTTQNTLFIKDEHYPTYKPPRNIANTREEIKNLEGPATMIIQDYLKTTGHSLKGIPVAEWHTHIKQAFASLPGRTYVTDYESFECSFTRWLKDACENIFYDALLPKSEARRLKSAQNFTRWYSWARAIRVPYTAKRASGDVRTSAANTLCNINVIESISRMYGVEMRYFCEGDDGIIRVPYGFELEPQMFEQFGLKIKLKEVALESSGFCGFNSSSEDHLGNYADWHKHISNMLTFDARFSDVQTIENLKLRCISYATLYPNDPIVGMLSRKLLDMFADATPGVAKPDWWFTHILMPSIGKKQIPMKDLVKSLRFPGYCPSRVAVKMWSDHSGIPEETTWTAVAWISNMTAHSKIGELMKILNH